jgi:hypothetical protein
VGDVLPPSSPHVPSYLVEVDLPQSPSDEARAAGVSPAPRRSSLTFHCRVLRQLAFMESIRFETYLGRPGCGVNDQREGKAHGPGYS